MADFIENTLSVLNEFLQDDSSFLWLTDDRITWGEIEEEFHDYFEDVDADLLATEIRSHASDKNWYWWSSIKIPVEGVKIADCGVAALLPLMRLSRAAAKAIIDGIQAGWTGHGEALIPTLVNHARLKIEDIGGTGKFTPEDRIGRWYDRRTWHWRGPVEFVPGKIHFPLIRHHSLSKPKPDSPVSSKVAFLFLTRGEMNHGEIWKDYLNQEPSRVAVFAHTKHPEQLHERSILSRSQITEKIETHWGDVSLVHATLALLRAAMQQEGVTHFILVSESCVPIRPIHELLENLERDPRSRMSAWSLQHEKRGWNRNKARRLDQLEGISLDYAFFQHQWMCLSREDSAIILEKDWTDSFKKVVAPDECYFATVLAASGKPFPDEIANRLLTWCSWRGGSHPEEFVDVSPQLAVQLAESGCYFARKFAPNSNIGKWLLHRPRLAVEASAQGTSAAEPVPVPSAESAQDVTPKRSALIVARYRENLDWLDQVPAHFQIYVINKGDPLAPNWSRENPPVIIPRENRGREADSYLHFLETADASAYEWLVFAQGNPFEHSPDFLGLLQHQDRWKDIQPLSCVWNHLPPAFMIPREREHWIEGYKVRKEIFSLNTLVTTRYHDEGIAITMKAYHQFHGEPMGINIAEHFFTQARMPERADAARNHELGTFCFGAQFAVRAERAKEVPCDSLRAMRELCQARGIHAYIMERLWLHVFGEPFLMPRQ
jgi:Core-2/I-Branching enzyme/Protein of unknown function (DUF3431)